MTDPLTLTMISMVIVAVGFILFGGYLIWAKIISPLHGILLVPWCLCAFV